MPRHARSFPKTAKPYGFRPSRPLITISPLIDTALVKPRAGMDDAAATRQMAEDMRQAGQREGGVSREDLALLGYTPRQIEALAGAASRRAQALAGAAL